MFSTTRHVLQHVLRSLFLHNTSASPSHFQCGLHGSWIPFAHFITLYTTCVSTEQPAAKWGNTTLAEKQNDHQPKKKKRLALEKCTTKTEASIQTPFQTQFLSVRTTGRGNICMGITSPGKFSRGAGAMKQRIHSYRMPP